MVAEQANRSSFETFAILADVIGGFLAPEIESRSNLNCAGAAIRTSLWCFVTLTFRVGRY